MAPEILHKPGGWHETTVVSRPSGSGSEREFRVRWRNQSLRCCGQDRQLADGGSVPVHDNQPHGLRPDSSQCRSCGTMRSPWVSIVSMSDLEPSPKLRPGPKTVGVEINVRLPVEMLAEIDAQGSNRSLTIRNLLDQALGG